MILYRSHRGGLAELLATAVEIDSMQELKEHIEDELGYHVKSINFEYCGYDERIDWGSYYVIATDVWGTNIVAGFSNRILEAE